MSELAGMSNGHVANGHCASNGHSAGDDAGAAVRSDDAADDVQLGVLFDSAHEAVRWIEACDAPSNDAGLQRRLADAVKDLEWATLAASALDLFAANEDVEELPTSSLKFLLLPAYLGRLTNKKAVVAETGGGGSSGGRGGSGRVSSEDPAAARRRLVDMVVVYLEDFLGRLRDYGVFTGTIPRGKKEGEAAAAATAAAPVGRPDLKAMNAEREAKIRRFKAGKEREERLTAFEARRLEEKLAEDEERKYWLETIDHWADRACDDLKCLHEEREILEFMALRSAGGGKAEVAAPPPPPKNQGNPFAGRPFILTRDKLQKQVFGMGYPSLPSMTVEEWYDDQVASGLLPSPDQSRSQMAKAMNAHDPEAQRAEEEAKSAADDERGEEEEEEARRKKMEWDEWKDDHRRGWGNRKNMG